MGGGVGVCVSAGAGVHVGVGVNVCVGSGLGVAVGLVVGVTVAVGGGAGIVGSLRCACAVEVAHPDDPRSTESTRSQGKRALDHRCFIGTSGSTS